MFFKFFQTFLIVVLVQATSSAATAQISADQLLDAARGMCERDVTATADSIFGLYKKGDTIQETDADCVTRNFKGKIVADNLKYKGISMFGDIEFGNGFLSTVYCQSPKSTVKKYFKTSVKKGSRVYVQGNFDHMFAASLYLRNCTF